ncbi:divergent polysaccharide deacetylase family protein [Aliisedimentitalea scapharcae]|uniref:Divergent polysaccharide deacetylase family protein n=1 Tax=Aliisedimentitalea scapharcae TaxID=1524259 RepID=A0ABZ2XY49_9RHOB
MRGFLGGVSIGAIVAVIGAVGLSVMTPLPPRPEVAVESPDVVIQPRDADVSLSKPAGQDADLVEAAPTAPKDTDPSAGDLTALAPSVMEPADKPQVGAASEAIPVPDPEASAPEMTGSQDQPVVPSDTPEQTPDTPGAETAVSTAVANPAQLSVPQVVPEGSGFAEPAPADPESSDLTKQTDPAPDVAETVEPLEPATEAAPQVDTSVVEATPEATTEAAPEQPARIAALPQTGAGTTGTGPQIGTPVVPLTDRGADPEDTPEPVGDEAPSADIAPTSRPFEAFAAPFDNPDGKPLMSILLIDDEQAIGAEALLDFPYPLSFAIDPSDPDATDKMARYRAAGFEVVAMTNFAAAATATDAETALEVWFASLPETVAVLEGTGSGIQGNRALSDQVTAVVKDTGRGLITQDRGLNTVQKLAQRDGVPSGVVFRDFDGAGQTPTVMRRFLDQAAFRAGQQGAVIMLGRVRPDTISALLLWGLQDRASRVALAPISASLALKTE